MRVRELKKPPVVRLPPKSDLDVTLARGAQVALLFLGFLGLVLALQAGRFLLAPVTLAVIVGLMLSPIATRMEVRGVPPSVSAGVAVAIFIMVLSILGAAVAAPLTTLASLVPQIWSELQLQVTSLSEPLATIKSMREHMRTVMGGSDITVSVEEGSPVENMAALAPALLAQILIFLASLYFFIATRHDTRLMILKLCTGRRLRWHTAHVFRDVENLISNYLVAITLINIGLGLAVGIALWLLGVPSAPLWGALAGILNFVIYIGPAIMAAILLGIGLTNFDTFAGALLPPLAYLVLNGIEAQFVTPIVIGRHMTLNPFLVFLAVIFWLWLWGPIGGFIAIPALLILFAIIRNIVPGFGWGLSQAPHQPGSRLP
ncbi:AI-2E family transporter [Nitratireductor luteus]|uniref:AI-2E family transporter n=1 Tax=Nitratireductor luteus TaxID=2976980 RepID=UPI00223F3E2B|nr:AI-2E family transporter [Nitratireductor luteus]